MTIADDFYAQRDPRSAEYGAALGPETLPVHVTLGPRAAETESGQLAFLSILNQLARGFRRITIEVPSAGTPILTRTPFAGQDLVDLALITLRSIDPYGEFAVVEQVGSESIEIGVGDADVSQSGWIVSAAGFVGTLSRSPRAIVDSPAARLGASVAACLATTAVWRQALGLPVRPAMFSLSTMAEDSTGCEIIELPPLDVGRVLIVGAGAVSNGLVYWLHALRCNVFGDIVDGDVAKLHNTNRSLCFTPRDTEWFGDVARNKADVLAAILDGFCSIPTWFHVAPNLDLSGYDVVLPLANDYDVRATLATIDHPMVLHASTGRAWNALAHRHVARIDDCVGCRLFELKEPALECSVVPLVQADGRSRDAALPFLSAGAGLMLLALLYRLADGTLDRDRVNRWSWLLDFGHKMAQESVHSCKEHCTTASPAIRHEKIFGGTRWFGLGGRV